MGMKTAFRLKEGVYLVEGAKRAALYDTNSGKVYSINKSAKDIILGLKEDTAFWQRLLEMRVAEQVDDPAPTQPSFVLPTIRENISLEFIWFEIIGSDCNERCIHCYADSMPPSYRNAMAFVPFDSLSLTRPEVSNSSPKLMFSRWVELIREGAELGCKQCQFIGGEPFLYKGESGETVLDLAQVARKEGYEFIEIFTNATLLTSEKIRRIKELGLHIAVSLYSVRAEIHNAITRTPGSFHKTMQSLEALKQAEIPTRVEVILMRTNQTTVEETVQWIEANGFQHKPPDVLRPKGRGDNPELMPDLEFVVQYGLMTQPNFRVDKKFLIRSLSGHNCLGGKITITESGDILPCIFSRNQVVGNVRKRRLYDVIASSQLQTVWRATKDNVLVCRDCEYRYVCFDCRPISEASANGRADYLHAPYPRCTYNPYTGEWAQGIWKVDEDGKLFYDRSIAPFIREMIKVGRKLDATPRGH